MLLVTAFVRAPAAPLEANRISVFVSVLPQKYFVERIGDPHVDVSVMVGPGLSPEIYEPTPRQMTRLSQAHVYFCIGVPFEDAWMKRIAATNPSMRMVDCGQEFPTGSTSTYGRDDAPDAESPSREDPHIWTSPKLVKGIAKHIRDALIEIDPAHRSEYERNHQGFIADLGRLDREIRALFANAQIRKFMVFHPSWEYFADTYGLEQIPIEIEGKQPGAKALARLIDLGKAEQLRAIFVQKQFDVSIAEAIASEIGAEIIQVDPLAENYMDNLRYVAQLFAHSMGGR